MRNFILPGLLILLSMVGMMVVFMHEGDGIPLIVPLLLVGMLAVLAQLLLAGRRRTRRDAVSRNLPGWALPFTGVIGGLVACAQLAILLAGSLQEAPLPWHMHVPGSGAFLGLAAVLWLARARNGK